MYIHPYLRMQKENLPCPSRKAFSRNFDGKTLAPSQTNPRNSWFGSTLCHKNPISIKSVIYTHKIYAYIAQNRNNMTMKINYDTCGKPTKTSIAPFTHSTLYLIAWRFPSNTLWSNHVLCFPGNSCQQRQKEGGTMQPIHPLSAKEINHPKPPTLHWSYWAKCIGLCTSMKK